MNTAPFNPTNSMRFETTIHTKEGGIQLTASFFLGDADIMYNVYLDGTRITGSTDLEYALKEYNRL